MNLFQFRRGTSLKSRFLICVPIFGANPSVSPEHSEFGATFSLLERLTTLPVAKLLLNTTIFVICV